MKGGVHLKWATRTSITNVTHSEYLGRLGAPLSSCALAVEPSSGRTSQGTESVLLNGWTGILRVKGQQS